VVAKLDSGRDELRIVVDEHAFVGGEAEHIGRAMPSTRSIAR
jgi:hypothetical protein